jgi:hypothetical protein
VEVQLQANKKPLEVAHRMGKPLNRQPLSMSAPNFFTLGRAGFSATGPKSKSLYAAFQKAATFRSDVNKILPLRSP